jgi:hypothetical protein
MLPLPADIKSFIDEHFLENPSPDYSRLSQLQSVEAWRYLADIANWDVHVPLLQRIAENKQCSEATALMIFWRAQPDEYTGYKWDAKNIAGDRAIFQLIKTIITNFGDRFYQRSNISYNPQEDRYEEVMLPAWMLQATRGETPYIYYDGNEVSAWFGEILESKISHCDNAMDLFNIASFVKDPEVAELILNNPVCDKGIALLLFWRLKTYAGAIVLGSEIMQRIMSEQFPEVLAYDPAADKEIEMKAPRQYWQIPEMMQQKI